MATTAEIQDATKSIQTKLAELVLAGTTPADIQTQLTSLLQALPAGVTTSQVVGSLLFNNSDALGNSANLATVNGYINRAAVDDTTKAVALLEQVALNPVSNVIGPIGGFAFAGGEHGFASEGFVTGATAAGLFVGLVGGVAGLVKGGLSLASAVDDYLQLKAAGVTGDQFRAASIGVAQNTLDLAGTLSGLVQTSIVTGLYLADDVTTATAIFGYGVIGSLSDAALGASFGALSAGALFSIGGAYVALASYGLTAFNFGETVKQWNAAEAAGTPVSTVDIALASTSFALNTVATALGAAAAIATMMFPPVGVVIGLVAAVVNVVSFLFETLKSAAIAAHELNTTHDHPVTISDAGGQFHLNVVNAINITGGAGNDIIGVKFVSAFPAINGFNFIDGGQGTDTLDIGTSGLDTNRYGHRVILGDGWYENKGVLSIEAQGLSPELKANHRFASLSNIENVYGSAGSDFIVGDSGQNLLSGRDGNDTLDGGAGQDSVIGGAGNDYVGGGANNDILVGGSGNDTIDGGADSDTVSYSADASDAQKRWSIYLGANGQAIAVDGSEVDQLRNIENAVGGNLADEIVGDGAANLILGAGGDDDIFGASGDDTLSGGLGNDTLDGYKGNDTANYALDSNDDQSGWTIRIDDKGNGTASRLVNGVFVAEDTLLGIENISGGSQADVLTGNSSANLLNGNGGSDLIEGGAGNDTLLGGEGNDTLYGGADNDVLSTGVGVDRLYGGTGTDTLDLFSDPENRRPGFAGNGYDVNLATGLVTLRNGVGIIAYLDSIENAVGSDGHDNLNGNDLNNLLVGNGGSDILSGQGGADTLAGGEGADTLDGGAQNDTLAGGRGDDSLQGGDHDDILSGGWGRDTIDGGAGVDTLTYLLDEDERAYTGVSVNLATGYTTILSGGVTYVNEDRLLNIENVVGTNGADTLVGNDLANTLAGADGADRIDGGKGNDVLVGGRGNDDLQGGDNDDILSGGYGTDTIDGGAGVDTVTYLQDADERTYSGVSVNLATGYTTIFAGGATYANEDRLLNIENVVGTNGADTVIGNDLTNLLVGADGADSIDGGKGNDILIGGRGNDSLLGGDESDILSGGLGSDTIDGGAGIDTVNYLLDDDEKSYSAVAINLATGFATIFTGGATLANQDRLLNIENAVGTNGADTIIGSDLANALAGADGNDWIEGGKGDDVLTGGAGNDTIVGGSDNDQLLGGAGQDDLRGDGGVDTVVLFEQDTAWKVDLVAGTTSHRNQGEAGWTLEDKLTDIENVITGNRDDEVTGNDLANQISTEDGNDLVRAGKGNDILIGGAGNDTLYGEDDSDQLIGGLGNDTLDGGAGFDVANYGDGFNSDLLNTYGATLSGLRLNIGTETNVQLIGAAGQVLETDSLRNIEGYIGSSKADVVNVSNAVAFSTDGKAGIDSLDFSGLGSGISVYANLRTGAVELVTAGANTSQSHINFENLTGSNNTDVLIGSDGANSISAGGGNDILTGLGGADSLDGGAGIDRADYSASLGAVSVNLATGLGAGGDAAGDVLSNIENLTGSSYADTLTGNALANILAGGLGNDMLTGGAGADTFVFNTGGGSDVITDFAAEDVISLQGFGITTFADLLTRAHDVGGNLVIDLNANDHITLNNTALADLRADDFLFA